VPPTLGAAPPRENVGDGTRILRSVLVLLDKFFPGQSKVLKAI